MVPPFPETNYNLLKSVSMLKESLGRLSRGELGSTPYIRLLAIPFKRDWFSGKILRCHQQRRGALGSIPRSRILFLFFWAFTRRAIYLSARSST